METRVLTRQDLLGMPSFRARKSAPDRVRPFTQADVDNTHHTFQQDERGTHFFDLEGRRHQVELGKCLVIGTSPEDRRATAQEKVERYRYPISEVDAEGFRLYRLKEPRLLICYDIPHPFDLDNQNGAALWQCHAHDGGYVVWDGDPTSVMRVMSDPSSIKPMSESKTKEGEPMAKDQHRDLFLGREGIDRLERLARESGASQSEVAREALLAYEISQSVYQDTVRDATLKLYRTCMPNELYDPSDNPIQEEAVLQLGVILGSMYAAKGIRMALTRISQGGESPRETYEEESEAAETFFVDEISEDVTLVIQHIGGSVEYDPSVVRMDKHVGRTRVTLPAGCISTGQTSGLDSPQIITLPGGRRLTLRPRGAYEMVLGFQAGD